jgi:hypothetical protein
MLDFERIKEMSQEERKAELKRLKKEVRKFEIAIVISSLLVATQIVLMVMGYIPLNLLAGLGIAVGGSMIYVGWVQGDKVDSDRFFLSVFTEQDEK